METTQEDFYVFKAEQEDLQVLVDKLKDLEGVMKALANQHEKMRTDYKILYEDYRALRDEHYKKWIKGLDLPREFNGIAY